MIFTAARRPYYCSQVRRSRSADDTCAGAEMRLWEDRPARFRAWAWPSRRRRVEVPIGPATSFRRAPPRRSSKCRPEHQPASIVGNPRVLGGAGLDRSDRTSPRVGKLVNVEELDASDCPAIEQLDAIEPGTSLLHCRALAGERDLQETIPACSAPHGIRSAVAERAHLPLAHSESCAWVSWTSNDTPAL